MKPRQIVIGVLLLLVMLEASILSTIALIQSRNLAEDTCAALLYTQRNFAEPLPEAAPAPPGFEDVREFLNAYVTEQLPEFYARQYWRIERQYDLEDRCADRLPPNAPPAPKRP